MTKYCKSCNQDIPLQSWGKCKATKDGFYYKCKLCASIATLNWKKKNPEKNRLIAKKWSENNKEKQRAINRVSGKKWRLNHKEQKAQWCRDRRALRKNADGQFTLQEWQKLKLAHNNRCLGCNRKGNLVADHIMPLSKGGSNYISNIQPLCKLCNSIKGARIISIGELRKLTNWFVVPEINLKFGGLDRKNPRVEIMIYDN